MTGNNLDFNLYRHRFCCVSLLFMIEATSLTMNYYYIVFVAGSWKVYKFKPYFSFRPFLILIKHCSNFRHWKLKYSNETEITDI